MNDMTVSNEWRNRPDDQRFLTMEALHQHVLARTNRSRTYQSESEALKVHASSDGNLLLNSVAGPNFFTNWSFNQLCARAKSPSNYMRSLSPELAADCLNYRLGIRGDEENDIQIFSDIENSELRSITGVTYGRIYDNDITERVMEIQNGRWKVPTASYSTADPKRATTLYASDRDVFIFLVDPDHPVMVPGAKGPKFRGFIVWNSEVGAKTFGLATFLYDTVCDNRIIWGITDKTELRIRHSSGAPERFIREAKPALIEYSEASDSNIIGRIVKAQNIKLGKDGDEVQEFLRKRGLSISQSKRVLDSAIEQGEDPYTAWGAVQGITGIARSISHTDVRVDLEREAGKIMDTVTA